MRWIWGGALCALALGGCAHKESGMESATPLAENETPQPMAQAGSETWRQPVAGHESAQGAVLKPQGRYQVKEGEYRSPQGEYFKPQGIYGIKGNIITQGEVLQQGTYGTYTKPEGTVQRPTGIEAQPQGTFYRPFGSSNMSERQPVAGHDQGAYLFLRDEGGRTWQVSDPGVVQRVEQKLSDQGCNPGRVDGKADEQFGKALLQFQQKNGLPATGIVDRATARALGIDFEALRSQHLQNLQMQK